jgi:hypothetical protein
MFHFNSCVITCIVVAVDIDVNGNDGDNTNSRASNNTLMVSSCLSGSIIFTSRAICIVLQI